VNYRRPVLITPLGSGVCILLARDKSIDGRKMVLEVRTSEKLQEKIVFR
jgi:hypothetical protein